MKGPSKSSLLSFKHLSPFRRDVSKFTKKINFQHNNSIRLNIDVRRARNKQNKISVSPFVIAVFSALDYRDLQYKTGRYVKLLSRHNLSIPLILEVTFFFLLVIFEP